MSGASNGAGGSAGEGLMAETGPAEGAIPSPPAAASKAAGDAGAQSAAGGGGGSSAAAGVGPQGHQRGWLFEYGTAVSCGNCDRDVSHAPRVACAEPECAGASGLGLVLCADCFGSGVEVAPHKRSHRYRVADCLGHSSYFTLWDYKWTAEEELRLIEAIAMFGFGNWKYVTPKGVCPASASRRTLARCCVLTGFRIVWLVVVQEGVGSR